MSVINTNVKSLIAQNSLTTNNRRLSDAMEALSTGKRITKASDDTAGLAISEKMTSHVRGLNQAVRNANDAISMIQTAEGALVEVTNMLQRMRELSVQSANDTNTTDDRSYLDMEFQSLKNEINRVVKNTQWNGMNLLDGSFLGNVSTTVSGAAAGTYISGEMRFQVGANANQTITHIFKDFDDQVAVSQQGSITFRTNEDLAGTEYSGAVIGSSQIVRITVNNTVIEVEPSSAGAASAEAIAAAVMSAINEDATLSQLVTATEDSGVLTITSLVAGTEFSVLTNLSARESERGFTMTTYNSSQGWKDIADEGIVDQKDAQTAIKTLDQAIGVVNKSRAQMGATINRLTYAADNLTNISTNTQASRSRILDADYAQATTEMARTQIIQQAATAMLAQANQQPQTVLALLR
jgi:flagellin